MSDTKEEVALVGADALTQLTCFLIKSENCVALGSSANRHAKELINTQTQSGYEELQVTLGGQQR